MTLRFRTTASLPQSGEAFLFVLAIFTERRPITFARFRSGTLFQLGSADRGVSEYKDGKSGFHRGVHRRSRFEKVRCTLKRAKGVRKYPIRMITLLELFDQSARRLVSVSRVLNES